MLCRVNWKGSKRRKDKKKKEGQDMYALLGLANERWMATESQIKNGTCRLCAGVELRPFVDFAFLL